MNQEKLSRLEIVYLIFWLVTGTGIIAVPHSIGQFTMRDGWISVLLVLVTVPFLMMICFFYHRVFPGVSLMQAFMQSFGRIAGTAMALWLLAGVYITMITSWRELSAFLDATVYPRSPIALISAILILPVAYAVSKGIKSVGLFAEFLAPLAFTIIVVVTLLCLPNVNLRAMAPVLADGWQSPLRGAILPGTTYVLEPLVLLQLATDLRTPKTFAWDMGIALVMVFVFFMTVELVTVSTLGEATSTLRYPVLEVVRSISIGHFIERLDTLYGMGLVATIYIKISVLHYVFSKGLQEVFRLSEVKTLPWTVALLAWAGSLLFFRNAASIGDFIAITTPSYAIITLALLPIATIVVQGIKGKKRLKEPSAA